MSATQSRTCLTDAQAAATEIVAALNPVCDRVEVAGSIRRGKPHVGDIDICVIEGGGPNLFDTNSSTIDDVLRVMAEAGRIVMQKDGPRLKSFLFDRGGSVIAVQIWITLPEEWGVRIAMVTGPAEFSHKFVTPNVHGGYLRDGLKVDQLRVHEYVNGKDVGKLLDTPTEREFFEKATTCGWIEPHARK